MRFLRASLILVAASFSVLPGCRKEETIEKYEVTYKDREAMQLRVAILPHKDHVWFIRMSGPEALMKQQAPIFEEFVKSVRFEDKKEDEAPITWSEPKGWKKDPPVAERFASYRTPTEPPMEVKITLFSREKYSLLPNLHRWQDEMNLPHAEREEIGRYAKEDKATGVTWVEMNSFGSHKIGKPVEAGGEAKKKMPPMQARAMETPFKYEVPKGWVKKNPRDQFTAVLYEFAEKDQVALITLTSLQGAGARDLAFNIKRWRTQVKLPEAPEKELVASAVPLKVAGVDAQYVDIANPKGNRILAVIVPHGNETWFVRMSGPHDWVGQNKNDFETFVKSFKLDVR